MCCNDFCFYTKFDCVKVTFVCQLLFCKFFPFLEMVAVNVAVPSFCSFCKAEHSQSANLWQAIIERKLPLIVAIVFELEALLAELFQSPHKKSWFQAVIGINPKTA